MHGVHLMHLLHSSCSDVVHPNSNELEATQQSEKDLQ